jgi:hypothetical protein
MTTEIHVTMRKPQALVEETARRMATDAVAGPVLFIVAWFALGFLSPGFTHFLGAGLALGTPVLSFLVTGLLLRRIPRWRRFANRLLLGSPLTLALLVLYFATFWPTAAGAKTGVAGLTERILIVGVLAWFVAMGWLAFRRRQP